MIADNISIIRQRIDNTNIKLVAVTKTQPPSVLREAFSYGLTIMGENRVQEAVEKAAELKDLPIEWHLIGHLQTNKARQAVQLFSLIHSVDSERLARELNRCAAILGKTQDVLVQVNVAGEETKSGITPAEAGDLATLIASLPNLRLCGVMTIAPFYDDPELTRSIFAQTRCIFQDLRDIVGRTDAFRWLSMGMTHDYQVAIEEGSTLIRIGTGIFGARMAH